jgi:hypothetical protein
MRTKTTTAIGVLGAGLLLTRDAFAAHIKDEFAKWARVIKASGATVD